MRNTVSCARREIGILEKFTEQSRPAKFAVNMIRSWWTTTGQATYPDATGLLICADGGGSNGSRTRLWKTELAALAAATGLRITVAHLPPVTSKWNRIEHRLFSHISMNWRGRPLTSHEVIVESIAATTTPSGLRVHAELDTSAYATGVKIPDKKMKALQDSGTLTRDTFHGEWTTPSTRDRPSSPATRTPGAS